MKPVFAKEDRIPDVVQAVGNAIVNIKTEELVKSENSDEKRSIIIRRFVESEDEEEINENYGSGVVISPNGIVVTNEHLISKAISIKVKFLNGNEYDAYVLGSDPEFDIALLKIIGGSNFPYLKINKKKTVRVGERAIVIGNPYGLSNSVTVGVISALGRNLRIDNRVYVNLIQTDAAINPGNSGGVLMDVEGNPIGIVTAIYSEGKGIGFAIPIDDVMNMLSEFLSAGSKRPIFGLFLEKKKNDKEVFFYVNRIIPGSPAEKYGIKVGDRIIEINRKKIREGIKLYRTMREFAKNDNIQLKILRDQNTFEINIDTKSIKEYKPDPIDEGLINIRVSNIKGYPKLKYKIRQKDGVVVTKVYKSGFGERIGLKNGDIIIKINNFLISNKEEFDTYMLEGLKRNYILYQVKRKDSIFYLPVKLDALL
ncbi:MAG: trypsin-like peptidase domain-containing protein [Syntrophorhabdaceae bacterium]|nr:trypsin-like peptidase domain-containing protein [Syntrophorhabdaceae bacterium]